MKTRMKFIKKNQNGAILLFLLIVVAAFGLSASIAGSTWTTVTQRAREKELLWRGNQIRKAIESYHGRLQAGSQASLPTSLDDLISDSRFVSVVRHLRRKYNDPMTGESWSLIKTPNGHLLGVHSRSVKKTFKKGNFSTENSNFNGKNRYNQWEFIFNPPANK